MKATVVDVRTPEECAGEHYPGAINIPLDRVQQRTDAFKGLPKPIIAVSSLKQTWYYRSGGRL